MRKILSFVAVAAFSALMLVAPGFAQEDRPGQPNTGPDNPPQSRGDERPQAQNAGGKWWVFETEDKMTAAKLVEFQLESDNTMPDSDRRSKIVLFCKNGKLEHSEFQPSIRMAGPNRPGFWGQPQMEVRVRVDNKHDDHGWNWMGRALSMDKGTTRELVGAHLFRVEFLGRRRQARPAPHIAEFSPEGLDLGRMKAACDITPKRP